MEEPDKGVHLPGWVRDWARKLLPWAFMAIVGAGVGMFIDNIRTKDAVGHESFRNNQQDDQISYILTNQKRLEARQDRSEERAADKQKEDQEFQNEVLERLRKLLTGKR
ncbi:MAG TPA: hypothetical protein VFS89_06815 [Nitrosospira sp.]|nr:hypothetical protein [Nitrosospira sp.]